MDVSYWPSSSANSPGEIAMKLQRAIQSGNNQAAMDLAKMLANMKPLLSAQLLIDDNSRALEQEISVNVYICKKDCLSQNPSKIRFWPTMTFETVKNMMFQKHGFLPEHQKWIIGKRLAHDSETLAECGINFDGAVAFLYLLHSENLHSAHNVGIPGFQGRFDSFGEITSPRTQESHSFTNFAAVASPISTSVAMGGNLSPSFNYYGSKSVFPQVPKTDGWECPKCTFLNKMTRPGCEMCSTGRPACYDTSLGHSQTGHMMEVMSLGTDLESHLTMRGENVYN